MVVSNGRSFETVSTSHSVERCCHVSPCRWRAWPPAAVASKRQIHRPSPQASSCLREGPRQIVARYGRPGMVGMKAARHGSGRPGQPSDRDRTATRETGPQLSLPAKANLGRGYRLGARFLARLWGQDLAARRWVLSVPHAQSRCADCGLGRRGLPPAPRPSQKRSAGLDNLR
jgi:hypothetical protein